MWKIVIWFKYAFFQTWGWELSISVCLGLRNKPPSKKKWHILGGDCLRRYGQLPSEPMVGRATNQSELWSVGKCTHTCELRLILSLCDQRIEKRNFITTSVVFTTIQAYITTSFPGLLCRREDWPFSQIPNSYCSACDQIYEMADWKLEKFKRRTLLYNMPHQLSGFFCKGNWLKRHLCRNCTQVLIGLSV